MANRIGVLLVGRNSIVREGLSRILKDHDFRVLQSVGTVPELCRPVRDAEHQVDLIVIDPIAWNTDAAALSEVKERFPSARIVALLDKRKVLTADPRAAVLSLKQVSIKIPAGTTAPNANAMVSRFAEAARNLGGCGGAEKLAADFKGEVVQSDQVAMKELPAALQDMMLPMQVGQATRPFGSIEEGVRVLVMCGRDEASSSAPTFDQVYSQLNEERINTRARRYLRDLRRDAVIDFR